MKTETKRTLALVEDDSDLRRTLIELLADVDHWEVVGAFPNAEVAGPEIVRLQPDLVLMDIQLPGMSGIELAAALKSTLPEVRILMLTVYDHSQRVFDSLAAGACGYLLKRDVPTRLRASLEEAWEGACPISSSVARKVFQHFVQPRPVDRGEEFDLTPRERETLDLLAKGKLYKEIASDLEIGVETVRYHLQNIYRKLHVRTRTEAVVKYFGQ
ncbi:DNA-binding NarL/FixJ family response regulator [Haloferula luteola]|uniref:DNA-binding NarL/FixJ family response regulator n=1 Tax=Haloferula luteola TaxID=595692 RepID=A0A840VIF5_9BACT|nr:response regulator transcription factor [Haloferula luteola]MBB5353569.1 DNA-binding NarL/FixJ family response regulator [Haloferula luteola]